MWGPRYFRRKCSDTRRGGNYSLWRGTIVGAFIPKPRKKAFGIFGFNLLLLIFLTLFFILLSFHGAIIRILASLGTPRYPLYGCKTRNRECRSDVKPVIIVGVRTLSARQAELQCFVKKKYMICFLFFFFCFPRILSLGLGWGTSG